ncbi:MAG: Gfo/Idh/MocA family oxidoreductase [Tannerella sp.]|jgi:predicted dehydrogenase|nr:Gfo/Idh/MocA family oxidoreductase [Tannerella sp.]
MSSISRRSFLQRSAVAAATFTIAPSTILGKSHGYQAPSDKLNVAVVGPAGRSGSQLNSAAAAGENIVALCDTDWARAGRTFAQFSNAKRYYDWRSMFDEMGRSIDAVAVGTPDHTHAIIASTAITLGKHVYCEKPLTHSVYESRLLTKLAEKHKVATQMGNQGASNEGVRQICDWIAAGEIGDVTKVECATNRPIWPQGLNPLPKEGNFVPSTLHWDQWIGPAKMVPYVTEYYSPFAWRGWWAFGTGALGDMACHIMHPVFKALKLGYPTKVQGSSTALLADCAPVSQRVKYTFPARTQFNTNKVKYPEVEVHWTDGGVLMPFPKGWPDGKVLDSGLEGPVIFHGTKDTLICGCYGRNPWLLSGRTPNSPKTQREVPTPPAGQPLPTAAPAADDPFAAFNEGGTNENRARAVRIDPHCYDWLRACKESPENRVQTTSYFGEAGPFNEMVVMGVLAVRLQGLSRELLWDGPNMQFTNIGDSDEIRWIESLGVGGGNMRRNQTEPMNAKATAQELIKHTYRNGWSLPAMP